MNQLIELAREVFRKRCVEANGNLNVKFTQLLLSIQNEVNLYAILGSVNELWFRINSEGIDAVAGVLDSAIEWKARSGLNAIEWKNQMELLTNAIVPTSVGATIGPKEAFSTLPSKDILQETILHNPWLAMVLVFVMSEPLLSAEELAAFTKEPDNANG